MKKILLLISFIIAIIIVSVLITGILANKTEKEITHKKLQEDLEKIIKVPVICQHPTLPTGCEAVAATMVLQYYAVDITPDFFAENWLESSESFYYSGGELYGPDPNEVFAGNPFSKYSYGCYCMPIVKAINANSTDCTAKVIAGTLEEFCKEYISVGKPILIWATMGMKESKTGRSWYLQNGSHFTWIAGEHCLVLVGYSKDYYYLNDPQTGNTVAYPKETVEKRYKELGSQAVYICRK